MGDFNTALLKVLGGRIKQRRLDLELNQEDVAKAVNMGRASISNIEVGRHQIPISTLYELSKIFKTDVQLLLPSYSEVVEVMNEGNTQFDELLNSNQITPEARLNIQHILNNL
jgi:transcriptional regulator with XRE-family HTH domain